MTHFEDNTHVFIVRIWLETREIEGASAEWRGVIRHLPDGEPRYFRDLDEITAVILPYLEEMGVQFGLRRRLERCLRKRD